MPKVSEEHLEAKRETILFAALACFARDGFHKTKMSDIAKVAGVSDGLTYRYFASKEELVQEAVQLATGSSEPVDIGALGDDIDAILLMLYGGSVQRFSLPERMTTLGLRLRAWSEALEDEGVREQVLARWDTYATVEEEVWSRARKRGRIAQDLDPSAVVHVLQAIHDGLDLRWALDPSIDVEACYDVVLAMIQGRFCPGDEDDPWDST